MMGGMPPQYTYRAEWDPEYGDYLARCLEFPRDFAHAATAHEAVAALEKIIEATLAELAEFELEPPDSLTDHRYSGKFIIRTSRALHARLTIEAAEQNVSLNQWVACKLADRLRPPGIEDLFE